MSTASDWCLHGRCTRCRYQKCGCPCHDDDLPDPDGSNTLPVNVVRYTTSDHDEDAD